MGDVRTMAGQNKDAEQEVLTPPSIITIVDEMFSHQGIALDPCAPSKSAPIFHADRYVRESEDGLSIDWADRTFVNPPYNDLRPWLSKAKEAAEQHKRVIVLVPMRCWRWWFLKQCRIVTKLFVYLR